MRNTVELTDKAVLFSYPRKHRLWPNISTWETIVRLIKWWAPCLLLMQIGMCLPSLEEWFTGMTYTSAMTEFGMSALHPDGKYQERNHRKDLRAPPEDTSSQLPPPPPPEENNPLTKLFMDVCETEGNRLQDYLFLTNRVSIHRYSYYCSGPTKMCGISRQMEFGSPSSQRKYVRETPYFVKANMNR